MKTTEYFSGGADGWCATTAQNRRPTHGVRQIPTFEAQEQFSTRVLPKTPHCGGDRSVSKKGCDQSRCTRPHRAGARSHDVAFDFMESRGRLRLVVTSVQPAFLNSRLLPRTTKLRPHLSHLQTLRLRQRSCISQMTYIELNPLELVAKPRRSLLRKPQKESKS